MEGGHEVSPTQEGRPSVSTSWKNTVSSRALPAMIGNDYQPHLAQNTFEVTHALFNSEVFEANTRPDVFMRKYTSPRSGESAEEYCTDDKNNCTAMLAAPVFSVSTGGDGGDRSSKEEMFKLVLSGKIKVTLRRLHKTDATEADD